MLVFPHYMWGYIELKKCYEQLQGVPSLYVRVYRAVYYCRGDQRGSLIICEGISSEEDEKGQVLRFPHYMWGYIENRAMNSPAEAVPSLYVRVYRTWTCRACWLSCSLIICEGISYIPPPGGFKFWLPSLYVRVYRSGSFAYEGKWSSLIICEGISPDILDLRYKWLFPHYMWGYIGTGGVIVKKSDVPSLYVRVYRSDRGGTTRKTPSLIICEGISSTRQIAEEFKVFPHYMWGYIPPAGRTAKRSFVPSLYMRVYRNRQWHPSGIKKYKCSWR